MGDPVGWFDLGAADDAPLQLFYTSLFGWSLRPASETYRYVSTGGGISGGIGRSGTGESWLAFYVNVDDPQPSLDRAVSGVSLRQRSARC